MKHIFVLRHAQKNLLTSGITKKGEEECHEAQRVLPQFSLVICSEKKRCYETAVQLTNTEPQADSRANIEHDSGKELAALIFETLKKLQDNENAVIITHEPCLGPAFSLLQQKIPHQEPIHFGALQGFIIDEKKKVKLVH
ncbi:histidine phosphatase family protein [Candidatus Woesearchaeota archaeon]|nr:histidine phosphatase family protein [Candidatus Woesearchaeota archaeon]